jgi:hypothetical protein
MCLLMPFLSKLWGIPFHLLPNYLINGAGCFLNVGSLSTGMRLSLHNDCGSIEDV